MTAVIRIVAGLWVGVALAVFAVAYGLVMIWEGTDAVATILSGNGPLGMLGMAAAIMPGLALFFTASCIDRRHNRR